MLTRFVFSIAIMFLSTGCGLDDKNEISIRPYDVSQVSEFRTQRGGYRPFLQKIGVVLSSEEAVYDSGNTDIVILKLTAQNHMLVEKHMLLLPEADKLGATEEQKLKDSIESLFDER